MKIAIDLQCCQTEAQDRGIGRYTLSLTKHVVQLGKNHDFIFFLNYKYLHKSERLIMELETLGYLKNIVYYDYADVKCDYQSRKTREELAGILRNDRIDTVSADIYHISSLFEGESVYGTAPAFINLPCGPLIRSATLYDFIPAIFPESYLQNSQVSFWYKRALGVAQKLDLALAISESTKRDAEKLLTLNPSRVVNISGDVDDCFRVLTPTGERATVLSRRLNLDQPYLLYVGGPDARKNVYRTIEAFALANGRVSRKYKLVIVFSISSEDIRKLYEYAGALGIAQQIVVPGFVSDEDLVELYNGCALFLFPSLYEGLGLPVIEAMRCGAPVLVADNSSLVEIVPEPRYRFDASNTKTMGETIVNALTKPGMLERMRAYSHERAALFSWASSAQGALDAWEEAYTELRKKAARKAPRFSRIAMFTPLPPAKTGIADYSADFIPALSKFASVDIFVEDVLNINCPDANVQHHSQFSAKANSYDVVIYQIGNSPFHHYMLPYIAKYPGVVVLHDAYLGHFSHDPANPEPFLRQVIADHGPQARAIIHRNGDLRKGALALIEELTCSRTPVHRSYGVIVHSQFACDLVTGDSRSAIAPQIAVIPQYRNNTFGQRRLDKASARDKLGLPRDKFIVASFGHAAHTKGILELIEGFKLSKVACSDRALLIFVGELEGGPDAATAYAQQVLRAIKKQTGITITGYVDQPAYDLYLTAVDVAVQLRTVTRGETSRSILDALLNGIPLIYNPLGSASELPKEIAFAIHSYAPETVSKAIDILSESQSIRDEYARAALKHVKETLDPDVVAQAFLRTVLAMVDRAHDCGPAAVTRGLVRVLRDEKIARPLIQEVSAAYINQERAEDEPRCLIDVTHIREGDLKTGVQRVVRELTRCAYTFSDPYLRPQTFAFTSNGPIYADDYAQGCGARLPFETANMSTGALTLRPLDKILLADGSWHLSSWMREPLERLGERGGTAFGLIHDILPLEHPELFHEHVAKSITNWLMLLLEKGAGLICTSQISAEALIGYIMSKQLKVRPGLRIGYAHLGANIVLNVSEKTEISPAVRTLSERQNVFVMVSTIEPRKGHACVLDAFETLWRKNVDATLVFVGKAGWNIDDLIKRFENHPEKDKRFFYLGFVSDVDLIHLYQTARAIIMASIAEGFGLPIYEAANFGAPLLLSDLPVFREIAGQHACYFTPGSVKDLASAVQTSLATLRNSRLSGGIATPSWMDCAKNVFDFMGGKNTFHRF